MHNALIFHRGSQFDFNLIPVFKAYDETAYIYQFPRTEQILNIYDLHTTYKLKDIDYSHMGAQLRIKHPYQIYELDEDVRRRVEFYLDMKPLLSHVQLIDVLETFNMFYLDDDDILRNFPLEEVW
jgi:hypothetical protein